MNSVDRMKVVDEYQILDTIPEKAFDDVVEMASAMFDAPISLISLIDDKRLWFKSCKRMDMKETNRENSICAYTINKKKMFVVENMLEDEHLKNMPFVAGEPNFRFYAGAPLITSEGEVLGTICVLDNKPRSFDQTQKRFLSILARRVMHLLELRKKTLNQKQRLNKKQEELNHTLERLIQAQRNAKIGSWEWHPKDNLLYWSPEMKTLFGLDSAQNHMLPDLWQSRVHPEDLDLVKESLKLLQQGTAHQNITYRIIKEDDSYIWVEAHGKVDKDEFGQLIKMSGTVQDITERVDADQRRLLYADTLQELMYDLSHKVRQPLSNCLGLVKVFEDALQKEDKLMEFAKYLTVSVNKIDEYTRELSDYVYRNKEVIDADVKSRRSLW